MVLIGGTATPCGGLAARRLVGDVKTCLGSRSVAERTTWSGRFEHFDDDHAAALTGGAFYQRDAGELAILVTVILPGRLIPHFGLRHGQKLATPRQLVLAVAMGEEAVVADALKAFGQDVQQKAADELVGGESHALLSVAVAIVFPAEADPAFLDGKKAVVGESDAMGVSRDISQNLFGAGEGGLA